MSEKRLLFDAETVYKKIKDKKMVLFSDYSYARMCTRTAREIMVDIIKKHYLQFGRVLYVSASIEKEVLQARYFADNRNSLLIFDKENPSIADVKAQVALNSTHGKIGLLVIDTISMITSEIAYKDRTEECKAVLKEIAQVNCPVFVLIEYGRHSMNDDVKQICRGVGFDIASMVDTVILSEHTIEGIWVRLLENCDK